MDEAQRRYIRDVIHTEGFDYGFVHYTDFIEEVHDVKFHELREAFLLARSQLREYLELDEED